MQNADLLSCDGDFIRSFREQMRSFHDLLTQKPSFLFIMLTRSSISVTSLMMRSMYLGLVGRMAVWCSWMRCPKFILCSATADLSRCSRRIYRVESGHSSALSLHPDVPASLHYLSSFILHHMPMTHTHDFSPILLGSLLTTPLKLLPCLFFRQHNRPF
jgi:hypothetical protein